ncbi:Integrase core domain protein [Anaplasma phagocytophilum]|nr:Integrase core domain protein [Anaplasma phagocytophilum]
MAYAFSTLTSAQQNYPQIEKEALAIRCGCKKLNQYIYGRPLEIETDRRPLETISKKPLGQAPPRLQRLLFDIQPYAPSIRYKRGKDLVITDLLSRYCRRTKTAEDCTQDMEVLAIVPMSQSTLEEFKEPLQHDYSLQDVLQATMNGWPNDNKMTETMKLFSPIRDELVVYEGLLFRSDKIVIPKTWHKSVLERVHDGQLGISSCLKRARESIYWPGMSEDIKRLVLSCPICESKQKKPPSEPLMMKEVPKLPWERVAIDLFDFNGKTNIAIVDSYSGFIDYSELRNASSSEVIAALKRWFSTHGIQRILESDNGACFVAREFQDFKRKWGFDHVTSSPRYPKSNGLAERAVQVVKNILKKCTEDGSDVQLALLNLRNEFHAMENWVHQHSDCSVGVQEPPFHSVRCY